MIFDRVAEVSFKGVDLNPVTDLRIQFALEKHDSVKFNSGRITIFNLGENARNIIARPHHLSRPMAEPVITVALTAGYRGSEIRMFAGDVITAVNARVGPDWITTLELFTGYNAAQKAQAVESVDGSTPASIIINRIVASMLIDVRVTDEAQERMKNERVASFSASGLAFRVAADFLSRYGLAFMIDEDGQGLIYVDDRPRDPNSGKSATNTFSPQTGLIGTPEITYTGINVRSLLRPEMRLFQKFFVESETITRTLQAGGGEIASEYHAKKIAHVGDTRGEEWYTEIEGVYSNLIEEDYESLET